MPYGFQTLSEVPMNQTGDNHALNRGQMLTEVKRSKVCFTIRSLGLKHHQTIKMVTALKRMLPPNLARALAKGTVMSCFFFFFFLLLFLLHHENCMLYNIYSLLSCFQSFDSHIIFQSLTKTLML